MFTILKDFYSFTAIIKLKKIEPILEVLFRLLHRMKKEACYKDDFG